MDDRGNKFVDSATEKISDSPTCTNPVHLFPSSRRSTVSTTHPCLSPVEFTPPRQVSFTSSLYNFTMSEASSSTPLSTTLQSNQGLSNDTPDKFTAEEPRITSLSPSSNTHRRSSPSPISDQKSEEKRSMDAWLLHHHRSRIKSLCNQASPTFSESPSAKRIGSGVAVGSRGRRRRRRTSSTNSSREKVVSSTASLRARPSGTTSSSSSSSPSRFLLTFLSSCQVVQVTSRLVVALAMTSLFLVLVHVMPGAYCSSSTSIYSQQQTGVGGASSSTTSITTGAQHHHATKRAYFNQSLLTHLKLYKTFQPLSSSTSSLVASGSSELSLVKRSGADADPVPPPASHQRTWLKTRWPLTVKSSTSTVQGNSVSTDQDHHHLPPSEQSGGDLVTTNKLRYSNQIGVSSVMNNDYVDNQQENAIRVLRSNGQDNNKNIGGNISAKNSLASSAKSKLAGIDSVTNYDYYNNGNNNNRSNYNYYDTSFVHVGSTSSSQSTASLQTSENQEKAGDNNTQQQSQNRGSNSYNFEKQPFKSDQKLASQSLDEGHPEQHGRASTVKADRVHGSVGNNGTTKAERDSIVNVSSTGVRPTMAFTNSYFPRSSRKNNDMTSREFGRVEEIYGVEQKNGNIQSDPPTHHHHHSREDNKPSIKQTRRTRLAGTVKHEDGKESEPGHTSDSQDFSRRWKKTWRGDEKQEFLNLVSFPHYQPGKSSGPTAVTSTTTISTSGSRFHDHSISSGPSSGTLLSLPRDSSSDVSSSPSSFKSIKILGFSGPTEPEKPTQYVNNRSSSSSALGGQVFSMPRTKTSPSSSTLSNQKLSGHHHYHEEIQYNGEERQYNEVFRFAAPPQQQHNIPDEYEDEVVLDDNDVVEENEDMSATAQLGGQEEISGDIDSKSSSAKSTSPSHTSASRETHLGRESSGILNKINLHKSNQASSHHHAVSPTIFGELSSGKNHPDDHLVTKIDKGLPPTASVSFNEPTKPDEDELLMFGDDPSVTSGSEKTRFHSLNDNILPGSTTASTFGKQKNPLQMRRDLSRLVANSAKGQNKNGAPSSLVGDDEEPIPNKCDRLFMWNGTHGVQNGTFESPTMISEEGHLYQCIFMFLPEPTYRVEVVFTQFNVRGTPPECVHEWVDIWTEAEGTDPTDLVSTPFSGRYCGRIPPRRRISLYGGIAVGFYSDKNSTDETIFRGTFSFINGEIYVPGTPVPRTLCSYTIQGASKRNGELKSPTYPGVYPKDLSCSYKFIGIEGQRIRLEFRDFDVFYGGAHCPFDEVKVFDGMDPTAPLIGTYCGQQRNLVVFSSAHLMLVTFTTIQRTTEAQNRGFKGVWEFSESFVKLDFIEKNHGTHIRGTECDQRILSKGQSSGVVYSPNYPFPYVPKIVCRYFIYGLQDPQHLERVRLSFEKFDVITNINSEEDTANQSEPKKCGDGFLKVYLKGQEVIQAYDKADFEFCGKENPHDVVSDGPRLVLVFSSGETVGSGFKGRYVFETEYRVPGTAAPDGSCHFTYYSSSRMKGEFNSPRFPSNYPSKTNCTYIFFQQPNEQVRIVFDNFKMKSDRFNYTDRGAYGDYCEEDWVEIWNVISDAEDRLVGRYCGSTAPGPIESREKASALKVILHTDDEGVSSGFKARYIYFTAKTIFGECGQNITQATSGELTSPNWPQKYDGPSKGEGSATCNWYLSVRPGSRVMIHFQNFAIEGEPNGRGCPAAAVRLWVDPDGVPIELCGEGLSELNSQYVSTRNLMRVTFITADKAVGAPGFRAVWTEVQERISPTTPCHHSYYRCDRSAFCIPAELRCNGVVNCGTNDGEIDTSDESECGVVFDDMKTVIAIIVGVAISLFIIVVLCAWGQRRKRRRRRHLQLRRPPIHVCDNAGARFAAMDSV